MTQRIAGFVVALERDTREDDVEPILSAIRMIRGVRSVDWIEGGSEQYISDERAREWYRQKLIGMLEEKR